MKSKHIQLPIPSFRIAAAMVAGLLSGLGLDQTSAQNGMRITQASYTNGNILLNWTGGTNSRAYRVEGLTDVTATNWTPVLATVRTNAQVPVNGNTQFYRVVDPQYEVESLELNTTNIADGKVLNTTLISGTNSDLIFHLPDDGAGSYTYLICTRDVQEKYDVLYTGLGGFKFMLNGDPIPVGGLADTVLGPGPNDVTMTGYITNSDEMMDFSVLFHQATNANRVSAQDFGVAQFSPLPGWFGLGTTHNYNACRQKDPAWAEKNLQCQAACAAKVCGFFPPVPRSCGLIFKMTSDYHYKFGDPNQGYGCEVLQCVQCCGSNCDTNAPKSY